MNRQSLSRRGILKRRISGQSSAEYLVILAVVVMVLVNGNPSPLQQFFDAMKGAYQRFTYAMSVV